MNKSLYCNMYLLDAVGFLFTQLYMSAPLKPISLGPVSLHSDESNGGSFITQKTQCARCLKQHKKELTS